MLFREDLKRKLVFGRFREVIEWLAGALEDDEVGTQLSDALEKVSPTK